MAGRREAAYRTYLDAALLSRVRVSCVLGGVLVPLFWLLDLVVAPGHVWAFLAIRCGMSAVAASLLAASYLNLGQQRPLLLSMLLMLTVAAGIEVMIFELGASDSAYYAGHCLVILAAGLLFPWTLRHMALLSAAIGAMYWLPVAAQPAAIDWGAFANNNFFLLATAIITTTSSHVGAQLRAREFQARWDLELRTEALRATTAELEDSLTKLRELDQLKSQFFANISHELRTPLTLILAPLEALLGDAAEREREQLTVIRNNAARLLRLIDELLDLSRLDAGGLRLDLDEVDLRSLAQSLRDNTLPMAASRHIELTLEADSPTTGVIGDAHRLETILTNLLANALKYTPEGGHVRIRVHQDASRAYVEVADDGPGIAPSAIARIFERFYRVEGSDRRREGGVGLGLALARELARLHGGDLTVDSTLGQGTVFTLALPRGRDHLTAALDDRRAPRRRASTHSQRRFNALTLPRVDGRRARAPTSRRGYRPRVLLVEDRDELRGFIRQLFSDELDVIEAVDGDEGWRLVREVQPDVVVSDIMMPGMSGTELCDAIKRDAALQNIPVILLTAKVGSDTTLDAYAHGADDFVAKPFHPKVLLARVKAQLQVRQLGMQVLAQEKMAAIGTLAAGIVHEVRNPTNAVLNAAQLLRERIDDDTVRKLVEVVVDGAQRIDGIVEAMDAHARPAEQGQAMPCDLRAGIEATLRLLSHRMINVTVHRDYATERAAMIPTGPANQVFLNVIDNAVRAGAKTLWIDVRDDRSERVVIRIRDDGPGVAPEDTERVFDAFYTRRGDGTGLGLYLSRRLVEVHDGEIWCRARDGGGTEFTIDLPAA